ncbi:unnamed protein product [Linum trigynum]|uniref:Uncharacterized protein n=1 Tax=Linum trigynum TaxID=586398 RepID=A0AAV2CGA5_9ROSI
MDEDNKSPACVPDKIGETTPFSVEKSTLGIDPSGKMEDISPSVSDIHANDTNGSHENTVAAEEKSGDKNLGRRQIAEGSQSIHENEVETVGPTKVAREGKNSPIKRAKSGGDPILIPIVLKMAEFDHKALLEEWISARIPRDKYQVKDKERLIANLKTLQDYLISALSLHRV